MASVNEKLLKALEHKLELSRSQVNRRIAEVSAANHLPRNLAAISLAADNRLPISRFATPEELAELRGSAPRTTAPTPARPKPVGKKLVKTKVKATKDNSMFVVHGRDAKLNQDMYAFLASIGIIPMEWDHAIKAAKGGANPIVGDVISQAMERVQGVLILFSPDEEAKVRAKFASTSDKKKNLHVKGFQPRPNVIFEAGLALGAHSDKTILVQVGIVRDISDIAGKHMVHLSNSFADRKRLADRLSSKLKFKVDLDGTTWQTIGNFDRD
ncbi:MAG: TIR domain-containing protein [Xanthobacteraceae bacterium]